MYIVHQIFIVASERTRSGELRLLISRNKFSMDLNTKTVSENRQSNDLDNLLSRGIIMARMRGMCLKPLVVGPMYYTNTGDIWIQSDGLVKRKITARPR